MNIGSFFSRFSGIWKRRRSVKTPPSIASRLLITDIIIALLLIFGAIAIAWAGMKNQSLLKEQAQIARSAETVRESRTESYRMSIAVLTLIQARQAGEDEKEYQTNLSDSATKLMRMGESLVTDPRVKKLNAFESGPAALAQLAMLSGEILEASKNGDNADILANQSQLVGNSRFWSQILYSVEEELNAKTQTIQKEISEIASNMTYAIALAVLGIIIALALRFLLIMRWLIKPAHRLAKVTTEFANADIHQDIPPMYVSEMQQIADALEIFRNMTLEAEELRHNTLEAQDKEREANAALERNSLETDQKLAQERQKAMLAMAERFESSISNVVAAVNGASNELNQTAEQLANAATTAGEQAGKVASASENATKNVRFVASATQQLSSSVREIAKQVEQQSKLSDTAEASSSNGVKTVKSLEEKTENIDFIVSTIQEIAGQTNLLALNATIEAARAGSAGAGFAVVASEVKNLAGQTSHSASDISDVLQSVDNNVQNTVGSIKDVAQSLGKVRDIGHSVANAVEQQDTVSQDISRHAAEAAAESDLVNSNIASLAVNTEQAGELSQKVKNAALAMGEQANALDKAAREFVQLMRAA